jgi:D-amino peptidase
MVKLLLKPKVCAFALIVGLTSVFWAIASSPEAKSIKVFVITDLEGVGGVHDEELQCIPWKSPRWQESVKLLTGEVNAAVMGLFEGGATEVVVFDGHWSGRNLSVLDIHPRVRLLTGRPISLTLELDSSFSAVVFIGQHAMTGAPEGILAHTSPSPLSPQMHQWINNMEIGEIGDRTMLAGHFGVPVIMLSGDTAACKELHSLVPQAECAEVKSGVSQTAGFMLSHTAACALIRKKARVAIERITEIKPYKISGPVEVRVEFPEARKVRLLPGVEQVNERTWIFRGKDIVDAYLKAFSGF